VHNQQTRQQARELYEQHGATYAARMTSSAIATDKARMLGAKEHDHRGTLSPAEQARATWAVQAQLLLLFDAWARRDPGMVRDYSQALIDRAGQVEAAQALGQQPPPLAGSEYEHHPHPDDQAWADRQHVQARLTELLEVNGYDYQQAMAQLRAEGRVAGDG
jgi:hypothetical protein